MTGIVDQDVHVAHLVFGLLGEVSDAFLVGDVAGVAMEGPAASLEFAGADREGLCIQIPEGDFAALPQETPGRCQADSHGPAGNDGLFTRKRPHCAETPLSSAGRVMYCPLRQTGISPPVAPTVASTGRMAWGVRRGI